MKIIQSFWSKPFMRSESIWVDGRLNGGWPHRILNYYSWALSCLQLRKYYDSVELVTDKIGKEIFIDKIGLPYTSVAVVLDDINHYNAGLWAMGKLYTYSLQKGAFLHVDGDIFIWKEFDEELINAGLIVQNMEATPVNVEEYKEIWQKLAKIPGYFGDISTIDYIPGISAGILGGNDVSFFEEYVKESFSFLETNMDVITNSLLQINAAHINVISEQVIFESYARHSGRAVTCLFPNYIDAPKDIGFFHTAGQNKNFVHCFGAYKSKRLAYSFLEWKLKSCFPEYYDRINDLAKNSEI